MSRASQAASSQRLSMGHLSKRRSSTPEMNKLRSAKPKRDSHRRLSLESSIEDRHHEHKEEWTEAVEHLHRGTRAKNVKPTAETIRIGDRIVVNGVHSGVLRYLGTVQFSSGIWAGVELDHPVGNNAGKSQGHRYFHCAPNYGLFVKKNMMVKEPLVDGKRLPEHLEDLNEEIAELMEEKEGHESAMAALQEQTATLEASFAQEMEALQNQCDRLASALEAERNENSSAQLKLRQLTEAHEYLKSQVGAVTSAGAEDQRAALRVQQLEADLRQAHDQLQANTALYETKLKANMEELAGQRRVSMEQDQSVHHWEHTAKAAELRVQQLELELEHAKFHEETSRDLEPRMDPAAKEALLSQQDHLESKCKHLTQQLQDAEAKMAQDHHAAKQQQILLENELIRVRQQLTTERDASRSGREQLHELKAQVHDLENERDRAIQKLRANEADAEGQARVASSELILKVETSAKLLEAAQAERDILQQQLSTARNDVLEAEVEVRTKEAKMGEYQRLLEVERKSHTTTKDLLESNNQNAAKYIQLKKDHELLLVKASSHERELTRLRERVNNAPSSPRRDRRGSTDNFDNGESQRKTELLQTELARQAEQLKAANVTSVAELAIRCEQLDRQLSTAKAAIVMGENARSNLVESERLRWSTKVDALHQQLKDTQRNARPSLSHSASSLSPEFLTKVALLRLDRDFYLKQSQLLQAELDVCEE
eukprot:m.98123 g.98123  ORF g.98123 m.98123 type:complete len:715 (+) comp15070_c0_seq1:130-2274(+)